MESNKNVSSRKNAKVIGFLYILATVAGASIVAPVMSLLEGGNVLANISENQNQMLMVIVGEFIMAVAVAGVAFMIYPILKTHAKTLNEKGFSIWYLGSRITEGILFLVATLARLSLLTLSQEFAKSADSTAEFYQVGTTVLNAVSNYGYMLGQSVFCIGAALLYYLMYKHNLVPRWLSVWGLIGAPLMLAAGFLVLIDGDPNSPLSTALYAPLALQEMVLAIWLIAKGFNKPANNTN